jgi:hypothetical protein
MAFIVKKDKLYAMILEIECPGWAGGELEKVK